MSRETMQMALDAIEGSGCKVDLMAAADALRAALAEQKCPCGDRPADQCPGEWEPGCDLGANEKYAKVAEPVQPVAWDDQPECSDEDVICPVCCSTFRAIPVAVQRLMLDAGFEPPFTTPPAPQSLRDLCAAAYQVVGVADGPVEMLDNLWAAAEGKPLPHDPGAGLPWSQPSPQPLTDEEILSVVGWERAEMYMKLTPNFPVEEARKETLKNARAVEAEVLKRVGVQR